MTARQRDLAWGAIGLVGLAAGWSWASRIGGPFVLPSLGETGTAMVRLIAGGAVVEAFAVTLSHAVGGAAIGAGLGFVLGLVGGAVRPLGAELAPVATAVLGVPPIAWIVLAFLWFGTGFLAPLLTVALAVMPIVFAATAEGIRARSATLAEMARAFRLPAATRFFRLTLRELAAPVAPALSTAFAMAWKVALTAEVLGDGSGVGGAFATARAHLDLAEAMAWIVLVVAALLVLDGLVVGPLRRRMAGSGGRGRAARPCLGPISGRMPG